MPRYATYADAREAQSKWLQSTVRDRKFCEQQLQRYDELLVGFGPPCEELKKSKIKPSRLYYDADKDDLWVYHFDEGFWNVVASHCYYNDICILHFYYELYHDES